MAGDRTEVNGSERGARSDWRLNWDLAFGAGFLGTAMGMRAMALDAVAMERIGLGRPVGNPPDWVGLLGTLLVPGGGPGAFWAGIAWHYANGVLFAFAYAWLLLALRRQSSVAQGLLLGVVFWVAAMLLAPGVAALHHLIWARRIASPGAFLLALGKGWTPALFSLLDHLLYGALVGAIYKHRLAARPSGGTTTGPGSRGESRTECHERTREGTPDESA